MTRFDIVSVFPEFFSVLDLSLVGKAQEKGIMEVRSHDLREWTDDPHRTVDDSPAGGGAGMVMRADVWGKALDDILTSPSVLLAIPTPSGQPLTQRACEHIAGTYDQVVIACGRYEGIDARVADHYSARGIDVYEYSLGDYVLNGGEVAAVALIEAVGRLLPGMVGNPESLIEESHGAAGLLEYPVYTRPTVWRDHAIPPVVISGDHRAVARWRRDRAIERTVKRRPDMIALLDADCLDKRDRRALAQWGYFLPQGAAHPVHAEFREAAVSDIPALVSLAARTFPDAAPPELSRESLDAFIGEFLSEAAFSTYLEDASWCVMVACDPCGAVVGYTVSLVPEGSGVAGADDGAPVAARVSGVDRDGPLIELSKFYVDRSWRGTGVAQGLYRATCDTLRRAIGGKFPEPFLWLGTNAGNRRAHRAYKSFGMELVGTRRFMVGDQDNSDVVFAARLSVA